MSESISQLIHQQVNALAAVSDSPKLDAEILMSETLDKGREWLFSHSDEQISPEDQAHYLAMVSRRLAGEPVAYITGSRGFWRRDFKVNPSTLVPRPETELLIEILLDRFDHQPRRVLDLGTGSGAIAVSLAEERPDWQLIAVDIDHEAVATARENAAGLTNIEIRAGNWFEGLDPPFDIIVSNPPYIAEGDPHLEKLTYEPSKALVSGPDGLDAIRFIASNTPDYIASKGHLLLEHGYDQQELIIELLREAGFEQTVTFRDLLNQPRAVLAARRE